MKRVLLLFLTVFLGVVGAQAQLKVGVNLGAPLGDAASASTLVASGNMGYFFDLSDELSLGFITGYSFSLGDGEGDNDIRVGIENFIEEKGDNVQFVPVGIGTRWLPVDRFSLGLDLGYAIGVNTGNEGGLYHSPKAAYAIGEIVDLVLGYQGVLSLGEEGYWDVLSLGVELYLN